MVWNTPLPRAPRSQREDEGNKYIPTNKAREDVSTSDVPYISPFSLVRVLGMLY